MKKISGKTHTPEELNAWANQNNPNNKADQAKADNRSCQLNPSRTHQQRRYNKLKIAEWAPDYPEWDD